ncbi:MAG: glycosyltransferase family 2 protein [Bacteroidales bacterium]|nr:glycosyltransferase family 2 protein [Bacteroidales bacterium]MDE6147470.1 glycosyltransferase family 2 protein [Bacteroidales bacterium]
MEQKYCSRPRFSVIVPIYGVEKYIAECAESLFSQTYDNIQFIFVNDGTKDASMQILGDLIKTKYQDLESRIVIVNKENGGLPAARKTGMEYAEGDYILHVDSDDWLETNAFELLAAEVEKTGSDIIYFDFYKEYRSYSKLDKEREYSAADRHRFISDMFNYNAYGYVWNKCTKRSLYENNVIYFPPYPMHEDIYLMSQLICYAESISHLHKGLYHYRRTNPMSITSEHKKKRRKDSTMNLMDLYECFHDNIKGSPVETVEGEILTRAGWYSLVYGYGFYEKYPYLAERLSAIKVSTRYRIMILYQLILKLYVKGRCLFAKGR